MFVSFSRLKHNEALAAESNFLFELIAMVTKELTTRKFDVHPVENLHCLVTETRKRRSIVVSSRLRDVLHASSVYVLGFLINLLMETLKGSTAAARRVLNSLSFAVWFSLKAIKCFFLLMLLVWNGPSTLVN